MSICSYKSMFYFIGGCHWGEMLLNADTADSVTLCNTWFSIVIVQNNKVCSYLRYLCSIAFGLTSHSTRKFHFTNLCSCFVCFLLAPNMHCLHMSAQLTDTTSQNVSSLVCNTLSIVLQIAWPVLPSFTNDSSKLAACFVIHLPSQSAEQFLSTNNRQ